MDNKDQCGNRIGHVESYTMMNNQYGNRTGYFDDYWRD
jgi:hypothetical protein